LKIKKTTTTIEEGLYKMRIGMILCIVVTVLLLSSVTVILGQNGLSIPLAFADIGGVNSSNIPQTLQQPVTLSLPPSPSTSMSSSSSPLASSPSTPPQNAEERLLQLIEQQHPQLQQEPVHQQTPIPPPSNVISNDNNDTSTNIGPAANSYPQSTIQVTSTNQQVLPSSSLLPSTQQPPQQQPPPQQSLEQQQQPTLQQQNSSISNDTTAAATNTETVMTPFFPSQQNSIAQPDNNSLVNQAAPNNQQVPLSSQPTSDIPQLTNNTNTGLHLGPDLVVNSGSFVTLDGSSSHSSSPDGNPITFTWMQIAGAPVVLNGANTFQASFTAPTVSTDTTMLFKLTVTDQHGLSDSKTVQIKVVPIAATTTTSTTSPSSASSTLN
jgi:hypothetical protein